MNERIRLLDRRLILNQVSYFDNHAKIGNLLNKFKDVVVPVEVADEISKILPIHRQKTKELVVDVEKPKILENAVAVEIQEPKIVKVSQLFKQLSSISGIGDSTATKICDVCEDLEDVEKAIDNGSLYFLRRPQLEAINKVIIEKEEEDAEKSVQE